MYYPNTKLTMKTTDANGNNITTTIGYCRPDASDALLKDFAQKLNAFTNNSFVSIQKVETTDIFDAEYPFEINVDGIEFTPNASFNGGNAGVAVTANSTTNYTINKAPDDTLSIRFDGVDQPTNIQVTLTPSDNDGYSTCTLKVVTSSSYTSGNNYSWILTLTRNSEIKRYRIVFN